VNEARKLSYRITPWLKRAKRLRAVTIILVPHHPVKVGDTNYHAAEYQQGQLKLWILTMTKEEAHVRYERAAG
jgi:hypothetical protein